MEMLSLTSRSFASGPAPLILPGYAGTQVCSHLRIRQGQPRASPGKARRQRGWDPTPVFDIHTPALEEKKNGNVTSVPESLRVFTSSWSAAGCGDSAAPVWSPGARQQRCLQPLHHPPRSPCVSLLPGAPRGLRTALQVQPMHFN